MERKGFLVAAAVVALAAFAAIVTLGGGGANASLRADLIQFDPDGAGPQSGPASGYMDYGDAPEGGIAYPTLAVVGKFPTCQSRPVAGWIEHNNFGAWFGPSYDRELDGDAGLCAGGACFPPYDQDECFSDTDAGLLAPQPFTINAAGNVVPCPNSQGTPLGGACQAATWGGNVDIHVHNTMPNQTIGLANLLVDWNQDGDWNDSVTCPGAPGAISEHVLVNFPVPNPYIGPLSALGPPGFTIGPNAGYVWARFSITERPAPFPWDGSGAFEDGESEDYLLLVQTVQLQYDWGDAPDPTYPTLAASNGARHAIQANYMLGVALDSEANGQPEPQALGDDNDINGDDEDGVTFTTPLMQGQQACVAVVLTDAGGIGGALDAWLDFNGDGTWAHPAEQIFAAQPLANGNNPGLCFTVPFNAAAGHTFARFRLSQQGGLTPTGAAGFGEVEDYQVTIQPVLTVAKTLTAPVGGAATISDTVTFQIVIHNAGAAAVQTLPLWDYYSPACLENPVTDPAANGAGTDPTLGVLHWANLGPLAAGASRTITVNFHANRTNAMYWKEGGWLDYAPKGMPDIDQKQDQWDNPPGSGAAWYYCGPVAAANSLWWFDSKFEPNPIPPPALNDGYPIVTAPAAALYDDHSPANVQNFVNTLAGLMGTVPGNGTNVNNLAAGIQQHLINVGVGAQYTVTPPVVKPTFEWVANEVRRSEDVILLLGFYEDIIPGQGEYWERTGGHFVTVAGVDVAGQRIAFSDPYNDRAEIGAPWAGRVLPAPHAALHPGTPTGTVHNDVKYLSHDVYQVQATTSPGGTWGPAGYVDPYPPTGCQQINNFDGQNTPAGMQSQPCNPDPTYTLATEVEYAVAVSPIIATVTCDPTTNIAVVAGAVDAEGNALPEAQAHAQVRITQLDWGDAPDPTYPTLAASNGAAHTLSSGLWLGAAVDPDPDGQPQPQALGDDTDADGDDEDGVAFLSPLVPGKLARITVTASAAGKLDAWIDFNGNGTWEHPAEAVFGGSVTVSAGANALSFTVPAGAAPGPTFARFRLSAAGGLQPFGPAPDGEVEDYRVQIEQPGDFKVVQPPDPGLPGHHTHDYRISPDPVVYTMTGADDWVCAGGLVTDLEWWGNYELDDYDVEKRGSGISAFHISIHAPDPLNPALPGPPLWEFDVPFPVVNETWIGVNNLERSPIYLYRFAFDRPFVQIPGNSYWFDVAARSADPARPAIWRWQESSRGGPPWQGQYSAVRRTDPAPGVWYTLNSDMAFAVTSKPADLGDAPEGAAGWSYPTRLASGGATHALIPGGPFMGPTVDPEPDGQPSALADGDDLDLDGDDEDGVTFTSALVPGRVATVVVDMTASPPGCLLNAWLDVNIDGDWNDAGEQIASDIPLAGGLLNALAFTVSPAYTPMVGITFARFRCSTQGGLQPTGPASDGEVEDYRVQIMAPPRRPVVAITIVNTTDVRLTWSPVTLDVYGNSITATGYRIYRATSPYAALPHVAAVWGPFPPGPITWDDAGKVGNPATNYYYRVDTVLRDIYGNEVYSERSNEVGEFDFALIPGS